MAVTRHSTRAGAQSASTSTSDQFASTGHKTIASTLPPEGLESNDQYQESIKQGDWVMPANMIASTSTASAAEPALKIKIPVQKGKKKSTGGSARKSKIDKGKQPMRYDSNSDNMNHDLDANVEAMAMTSATILRSTPKGNKRVREDEGIEDFKPSKSAKKSFNSTVTATKKTANASTKKLKAKSNVNGICELKWKLSEEPLEHDLRTDFNVTGLSHAAKANPRPRIWTNNRKELLAMMPEMTGPTCINGVSWKLYETPLIVLDKFNPCFRIVKREQESLDLVTTRDFVCPMPAEAEVETAKMILHARPPSPFKEPTSVEEKPTEANIKRRRRAPRYKSVEPDKAIRINAGTTRAFPSNEIPSITFEIDPEQFVQSRPGVDASSIPTTIKLEPHPDKESSLQGGVVAEVAAPFHRVSPSTEIISDFFDDTFKTLNLAQPSAASFDHRTDVIEREYSPFSMDVYSNGTNGGAIPQEGNRSGHPAPITHNSSGYPPASLMSGNENSQAETLGCVDTSLYHHPVPNHERGMGATNLESVPRSMGANGSPATERRKRQSEQYDSSYVGVRALGLTGSEGRDFGLAVTSLAEREASCNASYTTSANNPLADTMPDSSLPMMHSDQTFDDMVLVSSANGTAIKTELFNSTIPSVIQNVSDYIPLPIPEELQAMIDSYLFGRPLTLMASNAYIQTHWSTKLPDEYGYAMMGYFKILGIQEVRIPMEADVDMNLSNSVIAGRVQWKFHLKWYPGGEKYLFPEHSNHDYEHPWWSPPPALKQDNVHPMVDPVIQESKEDEIQSFSDDGDVEASYETTPRYRDARMRHHEYKFRNDPLDDLYYSLLPLHLLIPFGPKYLDSSLPKGWLCKDCGRMNFQDALRHRSCPSSLCMDMPPPVASYAHDLFLLRDPQEQLPLSTPLNTYPVWLTVRTVNEFDCGIKTFLYNLEEVPNIFMKHIFTSNALPLQADASTLLCDIQINVPLKRSFVESNPYFTWSGKCTKDITTPLDTVWPNIPSTMNDAKNFLVSRVRSFSGIDDKLFSINRLKILAWITAGTRKSADHIHAKTKSVIFCALGCTVVLLVYPGSLKGINTPKDAVQEPTRSQVPEDMLIDEAADAEEDKPSGWIADLQTDGGEAVQEVATISKKSKSVPKAERPTFSFVLMHGDILVLHGDEFEYSVKRDGTSLLLIASHDSTEHG